MAKELWAVNPEHVNKGSQNYKDMLERDYNAAIQAMKAAAEKRMEAYDRLPRLARNSVQKFGQLQAAVKCKSRSGADKALAVQAAYNKRLQISGSVKL